MKYCTTMIPMMAAPILAALIIAMREGAPLHPALTGALAGAASAGAAALLYASHCPDDSPLFVATWYPLATPSAPARARWPAGGFSPGEASRDLSGEGYFLINGSRTACSWSMVSSPP